jgi:hypothetical protein
MLLRGSYSIYIYIYTYAYICVYYVNIYIFKKRDLIPGKIEKEFNSFKLFEINK